MASSSSSRRLAPVAPTASTSAFGFSQRPSSTGPGAAVAVSTTSAPAASSIPTARAPVAAASFSALARVLLQMRISSSCGHTCRIASICACACTPEPRMPKLFGACAKCSGASAAKATVHTAAVRISVIRRPSITANGSPVERRSSSIMAMCVGSPFSALPG